MLNRLHPYTLLWTVPVYLLVTLAIGWVARSRSQSAGDFLNATRSLPLWVVVAAYLASNCGALEIVGLSAMAAQYGVQAFHFYWIGAVPAMVFLALLMMPVYRRSGVRSVPEYLLLRYGPRVRLLNAATTAVMLLLLSGISLYAMAQVLGVILGLRFLLSVLICSTVVLVYVLIGGIRATIYNEVLQLAVMLAGLVPLAVRSMAFARPNQLAYTSAGAHLWTTLPLAQPRAAMDVAGVALGLGFVLSFGYWCTDFVLMQRAFTAQTETAARQVPLWAGFGKLAFSLIVVLPGLAATRLLPALGHQQRFDRALPALMQILYGPAMLSLGLTALAASLMSGFAANVSAFGSLWTQDIYRTSILPHRSEAHYIRVGRVAIVTAVLVSIIASYLNFLFADLMEHVQLIFSVVGAPFWAIFLLGMASHRVDERGAIAGFLSGAGLSFAHSLALTRGWLHYGSTMSSNFYAATYAFLTALVVGWLTSKSGEEGRSPSAILRWQGAGLKDSPALLWILSGLLLACCVALNVYWR